MRSRFLRFISPCILSLVFAVSAYGQCTDISISGATYVAQSGDPACDGVTYNFTAAGGGNFDSGDLLIINTIAGNTYTITTCGLTSGFFGWDSQITILELNSGTVVNDIAFNDDDCGLESTVTFTAPQTTTAGSGATEYAVFITEYNCQSGGGSTFSVNITCTAPDPPLAVFTDCSGTIDYPAGNGNYQNDQDVTWEICPTDPFDCLELDFISFSTELGYDFVNIFEGQGTGGPSLGTYTGAGPSFIVGATSACVTIQFISDFSTRDSGFIVNYNCTSNGTCPEPPLPIDVNDNFDDEDDLVELFIGTCIQYQNPNFSGNAAQIGYFSSGGTFGMTEGIIMSTGDVDNAEGPNDLTEAATLFGVDSVDSDMESISGGDVEDCVEFSFEFQPVSTSMSFDFLFASEEFPEYVNATFNDVFGFFLSGPGITGPYSNASENIATFPNGTEITIDNVFGTAQYVDNSGGSFVQYDGYTTVITASYDNLQPCNGFYTLRLKLCDVGDDDVDSAVLLQANSFDAGTAANLTSVVPYNSGGLNDAYEGCDQGWFIIEPDPSSDFSQPIVVDFSIDTSDPTNIDYADYFSDYTITPAQGSITGTYPNFTLTIPAGETADTLLIDGIEDFLAETQEELSIQINSFQCDCTLPPPASIDIQDVDWSEIIQLAPAIDVCPDIQIPILGVLDLNGTNPYGNYTYEVDNGTSVIYSGTGFFVLEFINPPPGGHPLGTTTYTVTFTDECGREIVSTYDVTIIPDAPDATITDPGPICESDGLVNFSSFVGSAGGSWSMSPACASCIDATTGVFDPSEAVNQGIANPITISYDIPNNGCGASSDTQDINVVSAGDPTITADGPFCLDSPGTLVSLSAATSGGIWSASCGACLNNNGELDLSYQGSHTITYDLGTCGGSDTETFVVNDCCPGPVMFIMD